MQVLDALGRTLRLDQAELEHLYRLAEVPSVPEVFDHPLPAEVQPILDALVPLPAVVYNGRLDVLAWNATYAALFPGLTTAPKSRRNVLWQMFTVPGCCSPVANHEMEMRYLVATFRGAFSRHLSEPAWTSLVERLSAASAEFATMWARHDVAGPAIREKVFRRTVGEPVRTTSMSLAIAAAPDTRIVVYAPIDEPSRQHLVEVTANPPEITLCFVHAGLDQPI